MKSKPWFNVVVAGVTLSLACSLFSRPGVSPAAGPTSVATPASPTERQLSVFEAVFKAVRDLYIRADYGGADWSALGTQYRGQELPMRGVTSAGNDHLPSPQG